MRALCFVLVVCLFLVPARAEVLLGIERARVEEVIAASYNLEPGAPALIEQLAREHPESPLPALMRVQRLYWLQAYAECDTALTAEYERAAEALLPRALKYADRHEDDHHAAIVAAFSQLSLGLFYVEHGRVWAAFWKIRAGRATAARLLEQDPDYHDAKLPIGLSECYLERTPGYLKPLARLLGGSADMDRGLQRLAEVRDHGLLAAVEARFHLAQVRFDLLHDAAGGTEEMRALVERFPRNPFFQRMLAAGECRTGQRDAGRARYWRTSQMDEAALWPALGMRPLMMLCRDAFSTREYAEALRAAEAADGWITRHPVLLPLRGEVLLAQAESLKGLGRYEECFARFDAVVAGYPEYRRHASTRLRDIKKEIGWKENSAASGAVSPR